MAQSKITTPEGFREAIEDLDALLDTMSAEQAATLADQIKGAAPKASKRFAPDDLDDLRIMVEALKNRLRRKWKRQRTNNTFSVAAGAAFTAVAGVLVKYPNGVPAWVIVILLALGIVFGILAATSFTSSSDWREEVARPIGDVVDILAKALAEASDDESPYRVSAGGESTRTRVAPIIETETDDLPTHQGTDDEHRRKR